MANIVEKIIEEENRNVRTKNTTIHRAAISSNALRLGTWRTGLMCEEMDQYFREASEYPISHQVDTTPSPTGHATVFFGQQTATAQKTWEICNGVEHISAADDVYKYDREQQRKMIRTRPWNEDPKFFKNVKISALALLKMVVHARSSGTLEVMGLLLGKVDDGNTIIVMDVLALPIVESETGLNAHTEAYKYMTNCVESAKQIERLLDNVSTIGWYHSHPGYGCWLSGVDVTTQIFNQSFQEPFVAVVVDPVRTISDGEVCIGAFRTYPKEYKPQNEEPSEYRTIPLSKIEDFGVHHNRYYSLDISYFKSSLDSHLLESLWKKYWENTSSPSSLMPNSDYLIDEISDSEKVKQAESLVTNREYRIQDLLPLKIVENRLSKEKIDWSKTIIEMLHGSTVRTI